VNHEKIQAPLPYSERAIARVTAVFPVKLRSVKFPSNELHHHSLHCSSANDVDKKDFGCHSFTDPLAVPTISISLPIAPLFDHA